MCVYPVSKAILVLKFLVAVTVGWWHSGSAISALAYKDMVASTQDNKDFVRNMLVRAKQTNGNFDPYGAYSPTILGLHLSDCCRL